MGMRACLRQARYMRREVSRKKVRNTLAHRHHSVGMVGNLFTFDCNDLKGRFQATMSDATTRAELRNVSCAYAIMCLDSLLQSRLCLIDTHAAQLLKMAKRQCALCVA